MNEQVPADEKHLMLTDRHGMWEVHFNINESGDLVIDDEELAVLHVDKEQLPKLRDWLIKVLSP